MIVSGRWLLLATAACTVPAWGQPNQREPRIGYVYPGGGRRGDAFRVTVGGQSLRGVTDAYISGTGVRARIIEHYRPLMNLDKAQREAIQKRLKEVRDKRLAEQSAKSGAPAPAGKGAGRRAAVKADETTTPATELPAHPLLYDLDNSSLRELQHVVHELLGFRRRQPNVQIAESVLIEITIDANAAPGDREIRLKTPLGLTNPMRFQVGLFPETRELEPNEPKTNTALPPDPPFELPVLLNGQIKPGDVDRFHIRARKGQQLVIEAYARRLIPYLADAVPGWFQATLALYDSEGREVAFADDYRFDPDPVLFCEIPEDGEYVLEIRDSIYRGREDFVYRIAVGEQPFITQVFPLGGRTGSRTVASIDGWNLPEKRLLLATPPGFRGIRETALRQKEQPPDPVAYAVDMLPECNETEPNDTPQNAQRIDLPRIVNGHIARPGDVDVFQFEGHAGDELVAEVHARRLASPLDSLLRLTDVSGRVLEWNDDHEDKETGLLTHHADSYLRARLSEDGVYCVQLADSQQHGGDAYAYRLRVGAPRPDFALRVTPSSLSVRAGGAVPVCVYAVRKEGFDGDIDVVLKDAPAGFVLSGGRVPRGRDRVRMTLTAPAERLDHPVALRLEGSARIGRQTVRRPVVPAEDMMQAFIYRHLVPSQELLVAVMGAGPPVPPIQLVGDGPVRIPAGGTIQVRLAMPRRPMLREIRFELSEPPPGVTIQEVAAGPGGLALALRADGTAAQVGLVDNLIVEAFAEMAGRQQGGKGQKQQRMSIGVLPAIPFEIVQR